MRRRAPDIATMNREIVLAVHELTQETPTTSIPRLALYTGLSVCAVHGRLRHAEEAGLITQAHGLQATIKLDPSVVVIKDEPFQMRRFP